MRAAAFIFFLAGALFFCGMMYLFALYRRPGVYPPKKLLEKRAAAMGIGASLLLLLGTVAILLS